MANNPNSATLKAAQSMVREEDLQDLEELRRELVSRTDKARDDGRVYLMSQYVRLVALVTPEIDRIRRRFDRETLASFRKEHVLLKQEVKSQAGNGQP